jgi:ESS family glutamate:Na+ symporter
MGSNYEAAVMTCGYLGFGLGSTATAVASMKAMTEVTGPAPQAFLVVPLVGGFLVDLVNAANITVFINLCHG